MPFKADNNLLSGCYEKMWPSKEAVLLQSIHKKEPQQAIQQPIMQKLSKAKITQVMLTYNIRTKKKFDICNFDSDMAVGKRQDGLSISETADHPGISNTTERTEGKSQIGSSCLEAHTPVVSKRSSQHTQNIGALRWMGYNSKRAHGFLSCRP